MTFEPKWLPAMTLGSVSEWKGSKKHNVYEKWFIESYNASGKNTSQ